MATLGAVFSLSLALTILNTGKGLKIVPSTEPSFETFYESGTNLTISCSEEGLVYLDWHKDTSDLSSCSANAQPYCLPGGRYTYENGSFNIFLKTMKSDDCGRYTCKTHKGSKSFDLQLIDRVNRVDVVENSDSINMTTDCVYPTYTVNVQWFYIPEGGSPVLYNKPSKRSEQKADCAGTCWENKVLKVSSTLELPAEVKNPIKVKMMVYLEQGGMIKKKISANLYTIEGCLPPTKVGIIFALCLAVILIIVDTICICLRKRHQHEQGKDKDALVSPAQSTNVDTGRPEPTDPTNRVDVQGTGEQMQHDKHAKEEPDAPLDSISEEIHGEQKNVLKGRIAMKDVIVPLIVSGVIFICCIILLVLKPEIRIPDINGICQDVYITNMTIVVAVTFVIILICIHWKVLWEIVILIRSILGKMMVDKTVEGNAAESQHFLLDVDKTQSVDGAKTGASTNVDTGLQESVVKIQLTEEAKLADLLRQEKNTCSGTLPCFPSRTNTVLTSIGGSGKLTCSWDTVKKPSWQAPGGKIINYGGKNIEKGFIDKVSWDQDEKSIIVSDVQVSDAGTYLCFLANGNVQSIDLVVMLPTEIIETSVNKTAHLDPGKDITRVRPVWRRATPFVAELYNIAPDDRIELGSDGKSIYIKECHIEDKGLYEVMGNYVIKRFDLSITNNEQIEKTHTVDEGDVIRLDSSSKVSYPSWECVGADIFNYGSDDKFMSISSGKATEKASRFSWSVDKKSLMIKGIFPNDTGTYVCRHLNGFVESVTVIVRGKPQLTSIKLKTTPKTDKMVIPHNTGCKFPSVKFATNTDESDKEVIARQNFETSEFTPAKKEKKAYNIGYVHKYKTEKAVECSVYGRSIQVFKIYEPYQGTCSDNRAGVSEMSKCSESL